MRPLILAMSLTFAMPAWADFYLEGPELSVKAEANEASKAATEAGLDARVVRRLAKNSGWRYVVRVDGIEAEAGAVKAASALSEALGAKVAMYSVSQGTATLVHTSGEAIAPVSDAPLSTATSAPKKGGDDAAPMLEQAAKAHRVTGLSMGAGPVRFGFRRTLPSGAVADHVWARQGNAMYLSVEPVKGDVVASRLRVVEGKAWLSVDGGPWEEQNAEKAAQTAEAMSPVKVLPFILVLDAALESRRELLRMETAGTGTVDGEEVDVLDYEGDQAASPVRVELGLSDRLVRRVSFDNGELVYRYRDVGKVGALMLPTTVVTDRAGEEVDRVRIDDLDLHPKLPASWFEAP